MNTTESGNKRDGLHYQHQVILRNSGGAVSAVWEFARLPWSWRGRTQRYFSRSFGFALLAALNVAAFGVASIFTSEVTKSAGNSTIILGPSCGGYMASSLNGSNTSGFSSKILADTYEAATYVRQCYGENKTSLNCNLYNRHSLSFTTNPNATCPFPGLCLFNDKSAFSMDTGLLDSHSDLGINARPEHRIRYRRVTTCAPLRYRQWVQVTDDASTGLVVFINAGPASPDNYTFSYDTSTAGGHGYALSAVFALAAHNNPAWEPDALLNRTDADLTLIMLNQNSVAYEAPSDDPWMPAHMIPPSDDSHIWVGDYYVNLMACIDQYQICNPNKGGDSPACTKLSGQEPVYTELGSPGNALGLNDPQGWAVNRLLTHAVTMNMYYAVQGRGGSALNANEMAFQNIQGPIPSTQWHTEVSIWFSTCLAKLQSYMVEWATAPTNLVGDSLIPYTPTDPLEKEMCSNQIVHNTGSHQSFSVLGLSLILVLGGIIIILGAVVDTLVGWLQTGHKAEYRHAQWALEEKLQLHRAAYEGSGVGGDWEKKLAPVPMTAASLPPSSDIFIAGNAERRSTGSEEVVGEKGEAPQSA